MTKPKTNPLPPGQRGQGRPKGPKKIAVTVRLTEAALAHIDAKAEEKETSRTALLEESLEKKWGKP